jgi:hypothetical protein
MPVLSRKVNGATRDRIDGAALYKLLELHRTPNTVVEAVGGISGESASGAFVFGEATGLVLGMLAALGVDPLRVPADTWARGVGIPSSLGKSARCRHAALLFPDRAGAFKGPHADGVADAALIAVYAQRLF